MGVLNALKKGVAGAASAAVPMLQDSYKAQLQAERDNRLNSFNQQNQAVDRDYQTKEREAGQTFTTEENDRNRALTREENQADRAARANEFDVTTGIQQEGLELDRQRLDVAVKQAEQALEAGQFDIEAKQQIQDLRDIAINQDADPAERTRAIENLEVLLGESGNNYDAITMYGDEEDSSGSQRRTSGVLNRRTGQVAPTTQGGAEFPESDIEAVMTVNPQGTRDQAIRYLRQLRGTSQ